MLMLIKFIHRLMEQFDTLPIQCRHIEHMHEGVCFKKKNGKMTAMRT